MQGWALVKQGHVEKGMAQLYQSYNARATQTNSLWLTYYHALLAEAYHNTNQIEQGLAILGEAHAVIEKTQERFYEPELYRLKGELLLLQSTDNAAETEACFRQALDIAHRLQAKSWELRAATSLARLWQNQDKRDAARQLLGDVYDWFTEGFDTADLRAAKGLLDELGR